jgi:hypothetical protein
MSDLFLSKSPYTSKKPLYLLSPQTERWTISIQLKGYQIGSQSIVLCLYNNLARLSNTMKMQALYFNDIKQPTRRRLAGVVILRVLPLEVYLSNGLVQTDP